jgi:hypothetical protein
VEIGYPKAKYHKSLPVAQVDSSKEEKALGANWYDHPKDAEAGRTLSWTERGGEVKSPNDLKPEHMAHLSDEELKKKGFSDEQRFAMKNPAPKPQ